MRSLVLFVFVLLFAACVDPIRLTSDNVEINQLVVEGTISNEPGPYTVKLSLSQDIFDNDLRKGNRYPVTRVTISDDAGNSEELTESEAGIFVTRKNGIQGQVGRTYTLRIEAFDGTVYESTPEKLNSPGTLDSLYYSYDAVANGHQYSFYIDSHLPAGDSTYVRWKFNPTYMVETRPDLHVELNKVTGVEEPAPFGCSGVVWDRFINKLRAIDQCSCCVCWVQEPESLPKISDGQFVIDGQVKKQFMGTIPINYVTLNNKLVADVIQTSLSYKTYLFWSGIKGQLEGAQNIFQPLYGTLPTNIINKTNSRQVHGYFQAVSSITKRIIITKDDLPDPLPTPVPVFTIPCTSYNYSSTTKPANWPD